MGVFCGGISGRGCANDTVLVLYPRHGSSCWMWERQHAGILRYARALDWRVRFASLDGGRRDVQNLVAACRPIGIVSRLSMPLPRSVVGGLPVVLFDCNPGGARLRVIRHDAEVTAHLAAVELFSLFRRHFAYAAFPGNPPWCAARARAFRREVRVRHGHFCGAFRPTCLNEPQICREIEPWLRRLPKPCAVFAANDLVAENVIRAAANAGLDVPGDIAVVGVDDDPVRCERSVPSISSVIPDWEGGAFLAMESLSCRLRGRVRQQGETFRPLGLMRRGSTDCRVTRGRGLVTKAVERIREQATQGLTASDVVASMGCSRRLAEIRFREVRGCSILEEIRRVRFETARAMLLRENCYLETVARACGWKSVARFCNDFRKATGFTPSAWRRRG